MPASKYSFDGFPIIGIVIFAAFSNNATNDQASRYFKLFGSSLLYMGKRPIFPATM